MKNYKTIGLTLLALGLAGCGAGIQNTDTDDTDIARMYQGKAGHYNTCSVINSTIPYNQGFELWATHKGGENIGCVCQVDNGDGIDPDTQAYDVFDRDTKFVGRVSDHNRAQKLLLKAAERKNFDFTHQCSLVHSTAAYNPDGGIRIDHPLGELIGLVCNPSKGFTSENDLCLVKGLNFDVYSIRPKTGWINKTTYVISTNQYEYKWVGEAGSCKEAQGILNGLKGGREE